MRFVILKVRKWQCPTRLHFKNLNWFPETHIVESLCIPPNQNRDDNSPVFNAIDSLSGPGIGGAWDSSDSEFMDMLDGGMTPWTADNLTDRQSGVNSFLFPF